MARAHPGQQNTHENGVIYARFSSHNQKEESIEQQVAECTAFALENHINIIEVYADKAISGRTDRRSSFQRMMRDAEKKKFTVVIAYKSNRIARNMFNALSYENKLQSYGIRTVYAKEEFGNTAAGRFALRTMMNVNQFYSENMAEDIRRGMADNAANCKVNGPLPLGYKNVNGFYAIDEPKAAIVREIYDRFLNDETLAGIGLDLNTRGIRTSYGNFWNKNSFHRLLSNENYIGTYHHSGVVKEDGIPAIISKEVFFTVQEKLKVKKQSQAKRRSSADYLLTGKLRCGYCKSYMVGLSGTGKSGELYHYYGCNERRTAGNCKKHNVKKDWIEQRIAELTKEYILRDDVIEWIAQSAIEFQRSAGRASEIASMEKELSAAKKAAKNIVAAIEQGIITATTRERLLALEDEAAMLERSLAVARAANQPMEKERIVYFLKSFRDGNAADKKYQALMINTFVREVYLWDDKIGIDYYYMDRKSAYTFDLEAADIADIADIADASDIESPTAFAYTPLWPTKCTNTNHRY